MQIGFAYAYKPLAIVIWVLTMIGPDPYDILINHTLVFMYLASLYQFRFQPSNAYIIFDQLRYFSFDYLNV